MRVFGKINLFLNVFVKEGDFHAIQSVFAPCFDIYDDISVRVCDEDEAGVFFSVSPVIYKTQSAEFCEKYTKQVAALAKKEDNAAKAVRLFCEEFGDVALRVEIEKGIPFLAGMGGSSADAVGVLKCLCEMFSKTQADVVDIMAAIGSDLAGMWSGGVNYCWGRGEKAVEIAKSLGGFAVLCTPEFGVSTKAVFEKFDNIEGGIEYFPYRECYREECDYFEVADGLSNALERSAFAVSPQLYEFASAIEQATNECFHMTGSGSGLFCLAKERKKAEEIYAKIKDKCAFCAVVCI